jgi:hypothetical protein
VPVVDEIKVETKLLSQVMDGWGGDLSLPVVQREFEWESDRILKLVDSIVRGYPIGAIILWESGEIFPGSPLMDSNTDLKSLTTHTYVIDGQQRLTALLLLKHAWTMKRDKRLVTCDPISYNPANRRFYISEKKGIDISLLVNASLASSEALDSLKAKFPSDYKAAIDDIGSKIVNYPVPIYVLKTKHKVKEDEDVSTEIAEIFTRINSEGIPLGNIQLFLSFFAAAFSDLKTEMVDRYYEINESYNREFPSWEVMNRFFFGNLGMTQNQITRIDSFKNGIREIKDEYTKKSKKMKSIVRNSYSSADAMLALVSNELGIFNASRLPSQNAFLPLFKWAYNKGVDSPSQIKVSARWKMLRWFVIASFNGWYGSYINRRIQKDLEAVEEQKVFPIKHLLSHMEDENIPTKIEKRDIISKSSTFANVYRDRSYMMLLNVLLHRNGVSNWAGEVVTSRNTAIHHIFPRDYLKENGVSDDDLINDLGNLTLISPPINSEISDDPPDIYLPKYRKEFLKSHSIPLDPKLWRLGNYEKFLTERTKLLWGGVDSTINSG